MTPQSPSQPLSTDNGFPMLAIAILGIIATAFLLISYYIFITKCCFRWHLTDPLRRFSEHPSPSSSPSPSPSLCQTRGLNELLIREIPTLQYDKETSTLSKCVVCLNDFQHHDMLRLLPKCNHAFHLDCIDVWLLTNSNCPLCRSAISGRNRYLPVDTIVAPNSSPQHLQDEIGDDSTSHSSTKMEIKIAKSKHRKVHHFSIMGDEGINVREKKDDDDQFGFQPIRRSFSMDSAIYIVGQVRDSEESSSRRSIFSFGQGRGSKIALLPY